MVGRSEASHSAVRHLLRRFFNDSPELLVLNVLKHERIDTQGFADAVGFALG